MSGPVSQQQQKKQTPIHQGLGHQDAMRMPSGLPPITVIFFTISQFAIGFLLSCSRCEGAFGKVILKKKK